MNSSSEISKSYRINKRADAYTLIELVLVVAILSILLGIGVHRLSGLRFFEAERQLHKMENDLRVLRMESIRNRKATALVVENGGYKVYIEGEETYKDTFQDELELVGIRTSDKTSRFIFSKSGRPSISGSFIFKIGKKEKELVVAPVTGKISLRNSDEKNGSL